MISELAPRSMSQSIPAAGDRFAYTGREWESAAGLYYYRARFYDAAAGRFISHDPVSFEGGDANLYRYVGNATTQLVDPSGLTVTAESAQQRSARKSTLSTIRRCIAENFKDILVEASIYLKLVNTNNYIEMTKQNPIVGSEQQKNKSVNARQWSF